MRFPNLFSPFVLRHLIIPNRIFSTGHDTDLGRHGLPGDALVAYQRARGAGGAGVEIVGSQGYLPAQFLSAAVNQRADRYGGSFENRLRFMREVAASVRRQATAELIPGTRLSASECDADGIDEDETLGICRALKDDFDYFNVIAGTSASSAGAAVRLGTTVTPELLAAERPEVVLVATGSVPQIPHLDRGEGVEIVRAEHILTGGTTSGPRVVIYDWLADWTGVGIAEKLAAEGAHVRLAINGVCAAISIQNYTRDAAIARLRQAGVEMLPFMRLYGAEAGSVYFLHTAAQEPVVLEGVDTLVIVGAHRPLDELAAPARKLGIETHGIGDALSPRAAEEAVFEALSVATRLG